MIEIKVRPHPRQKFSVVINNRRVTFELWYSQTTDRWSMDLAIDSAPVLSGRRIVAGVDLLAAFGFDIGVLFCYGQPTNRSPGRDDLPLGYVRLYSATQDEVNAAVAA